MQSLKVYLAAFVAGLVIFGIIAFSIPGIISVSDDEKKHEETVQTGVQRENEDKTDKEEKPIRSEDGFTAIVGGYDGTSGELDGLLFIKADGKNNRFILSAIPTTSSVVVTSTDPVSNVSVRTNVRLKDFPILYPGDKGTEKIVSAMKFFTGMDIDYYAFFDTSSALKLFEETQGLYYEVKEDLVYIGNGTASNPEINIKAGGQVLNAKQIIGLLRFSYYTTDERRNAAERASVQADFIDQAIIQIMKADSEKLISGVTKILTGCKTNFTVSDFKEHYGLISRYGDYKSANIIVKADLADPIIYQSSQKLFEIYK